MTYIKAEGMVQVLIIVTLLVLGVWKFIDIVRYLV